MVRRHAGVSVTPGEVGDMVTISGIIARVTNNPKVRVNNFVIVVLLVISLPKCFHNKLKISHTFVCHVWYFRFIFYSKYFHPRHLSGL